MTGLLAFRADASVEIGSGHVMRCLTLARALRDAGREVLFVSRALQGNLNAHIRREGFALAELPAPDAAEHGRSPTAHAAWLGVDWQKDAQQTAEALRASPPEWLILDHYALDAAWQRAALPEGCRLMVIDDLADRPHHADLLLDQNLGRAAEDYAALVPPGCTVLAGPRYALLRPEFARLRAAALARREDRRQEQPALRNLLVFLGGMDKDNVTGLVLSALAACPLPEAARVTVVMGSSAPALAAVRAQCAGLPFPVDLRVDAGNMAELMAQADLAIGAAGSTSWERCCLGLPTIVVSVAQNQTALLQRLRLANAAMTLDLSGEDDVVRRLGACLDRLSDPGRYAAMSAAAAEICDGGGTDRVVRHVLGCRTGEA